MPQPVQAKLPDIFIDESVEPDPIYNKQQVDLLIQDVENKINNIDTTELTNKILNQILVEFPDLAHSTIVYEYTGTGYANFDETITVSNNWSEFDYIEVFCKTNDEWNLYQKLYNPNNQILTFSAANVTGSGRFVMKTKTFSFTGNKIEAVKMTWGNKLPLSGQWLSRNYSDSSTLDSVTQNSSYIGISKIIGYKRPTISAT